MKRVLITTTSFQDTPGSHHSLLGSKGYEIVSARGPLTEAAILDLVGDFDGILCGDDAYTRPVLEKCLPRLKVLSKYGIGLDKIDVAAATALKIPVCFTPGVNHTTVAEHTFGLLLAIYRNMITEVNHVKSGNWKRLTGHELHGKTLGVVGLGRIGREVVTRARAFGMEVIGHDLYWDDAFAAQHNVTRAPDIEYLTRHSDVITLHTNLTDETRHLINAERIAAMKDGAVVLNCARGEIVDNQAIVEGLASGKLYGYGADVLDEEPPPADHPLLHSDRAIITPHIGSRTYESVIRQATKSVENIIAVLEGRPPVAQANTI
ncbi:MAG: phosphoglycerate dehydrogenase [Terrimicrobiaceae bacterium]|nr:phosphoglycerate dehydrogenase [Terrimicrobiaceae bacterium]